MCRIPDLATFASPTPLDPEHSPHQPPLAHPHHLHTRTTYKRQTTLTTPSRFILPSPKDCKCRKSCKTLLGMIVTKTKALVSKSQTKGQE